MRGADTIGGLSSKTSRTGPYDYNLDNAFATKYTVLSDVPTCCSVATRRSCMLMVRRTEPFCIYLLLGPGSSSAGAGPASSAPVRPAQHRYTHREHDQ